MRRKVILLGIVLTTILPFILAKYMINSQANVIVWTLYIIPNILIFLLSPKWSTAIFSNLIYTFVEVCSQYYFFDAQHISDKTVLVLLPTLNSAVFFLFCYIRRKSLRLNSTLMDLAYHDPLTGIDNRRQFEEILERNILSFFKDRIPFHLILFDIDYFKSINDKYGHACGDYILKELAGVVKSELREEDMFARIGGEEFAILLSNMNRDEGKSIAERICQNVSQHSFVHEGITIKVTVSIGFATYKGEPLDTFMEMVDSALYKAKNNGRNQVVIVS